MLSYNSNKSAKYLITVSTVYRCLLFPSNSCAKTFRLNCLHFQTCSLSCLHHSFKDRDHYFKEKIIICLYFVVNRRRRLRELHSEMDCLNGDLSKFITCKNPTKTYDFIAIWKIGSATASNLSHLPIRTWF